jgi:phage-related protein
MASDGGFGLRPVVWVGSAKRDFLDFPGEVQEIIGYELYLVQVGSVPIHAKPLHGILSGVWEIAIAGRSGAYRLTYSARSRYAVYALHAFQKKATMGVSTSYSDIQLILRRLRVAKEYDKSKESK